jgi:hypothetical protein
MPDWIRSTAIPDILDAEFEECKFSIRSGIKR